MFTWSIIFALGSAVVGKPLYKVPAVTVPELVQGEIPESED